MKLSGGCDNTEALTGLSQTVTLPNEGNDILDFDILNSIHEKDVNFCFTLCLFLSFSLSLYITNSISYVYVAYWRESNYPCNTSTER